MTILDLSPNDSTLILSAQFSAPPERVFAAWLDPNALAHWIRPSPECRVVVEQYDVQVGGAFRVKMILAEGEFAYGGTFTRIDSPTYLEMTWQWDSPDDDPYPETFLLVECQPDSGGTRLTLTHTKLRSLESRDAHAEGWSGSLNALDRYLQS